MLQRICFLASIVAFGAVAVCAYLANANKTHVARARGPRTWGYFPVIGSREDYTDRGWRYHNLMIVAVLIAVLAGMLGSVLEVLGR